MINWLLELTGIRETVTWNYRIEPEVFRKRRDDP